MAVKRECPLRRMTFQEELHYTCVNFPTLEIHYYYGNMQWGLNLKNVHKFRLKKFKLNLLL